jgi:DNA-binding HxlR family transcriptional regulator
MPPTGRSFCSDYHRAIELIGRRWTGSIIRALLGGQLRYSAIRAAIPDLSERLLSERLKELEREGIVLRRVIPDSPVRVEYALTAKGEALDRVVQAVADWARAWPQDSCRTENGLAVATSQPADGAARPAPAGAAPSGGRLPSVKTDREIHQ